MTDLASDPDVQQVLHMMALAGVSLSPFIEGITDVQHKPKAIGFNFDCKDSFSLMKTLEQNPHFRADDPTSWVGAEASSNARKSGISTPSRLRPPESWEAVHSTTTISSSHIGSTTFCPR